MFYPALTVLAVIGIWLALRLRSFIANVRRARRTGLPYTFSAVTELETWAYLTDPLIRKFYREHLLAEQRGWPRWARFMVKDWMYEDKYRAHEEFGDIFLVVSPGGMICYVADPDVAQDVCMRRRDFIKPREKMKMIEPFGPNVVSSEGDLWRFHYRITAPPFGDAANFLVWDETKRQTELLKAAWVRNGVQALKSDIYSVGVNVMASAGFGRQQDWQSDRAPPTGHQLSLLESVYGIVTYLPLLLLLPKWLLRSVCRPAFIAFVEFEGYMREYIAEEQSVVREHTLNSKGQLSGNLLTAMLATNANEQKAQGSKGDARVALTDDEVLGNMFMFFMAGYDTTANTIIFSCVALALFEDVQEEMVRELDEVVRFSQAHGREELSYTEDFPRLRYMLAFMYETLRVFPVVLPIGRVTSGPQSFRSKSATSLNPGLPADCGVVVNITGVHYNQQCWSEPHVFEPKRWLSRNPNSYVPGRESQVDPDMRIPNHKRGTFLTFSEGPRACLGRRFAQAEYVCFFSEILKHHQLRLASGVDKTEVESLFRSCSAGSPITLAPPADVKLCLVKR